MTRRCWFWHRFRTAFSSRGYDYRECETCGFREARGKLRYDHAPVDWTWLRAGWSGWRVRDWGGTVSSADDVE